MSLLSRGMGPDGSKLISYEKAVSKINQSARQTAEILLQRQSKNAIITNRDGVFESPKVKEVAEVVPLLEALSRVSAEAVYTHRHTPQHDTSAMDGFAVCSKDTTLASINEPVVFRIAGSIAAGDEPKTSATLNFTEKVCVEIMTGARFPESAHPSLDAVVKVEDVVVVEQWCNKQFTVKRYIQVTRPVKRAQNRRPAGSDFSVGDLIVDQHAVIGPKHIAALASVGISSIPVTRLQEKSIVTLPLVKYMPDFRIGVLSTGSEITAPENMEQSRQGQKIADSNGPYLVSALRMAIPHARVEHLGIAIDTEDSLTSHLNKAVEANFDIIITSGGVSKGRHDLVRHVIQNELDGDVVFHGVAVRPGAPVLFATHDRSSTDGTSSRVAIFGAPGNPLAVAMTLRFFIMPYIESIQAILGMSNTREFNTEKMNSMDRKDGVSVIAGEDSPCQIAVRTKPKGMTVFWLASNRKNSDGQVDVLEDQASYKLKGLLSADCWVVVPEGRGEVRQGDLLTSCPL